MSDGTHAEQKSGNLTALMRAAAAFGYEVAAAIKNEDAENARALKLVLDRDPAAEFHVSVMLAPSPAFVVSVVTGGKQYIIAHGPGAIGDRIIN